MKTIEIAKQVELGFSNIYKHFSEFQCKEYKQYWDICMNAISDKELMSHIVFCNDYLQIPPVKTFLIYYDNNLPKLSDDADLNKVMFLKRSIGAFWGMVFKFCLGYRQQKQVSISQESFVKFSTATYFIK